MWLIRPAGESGRADTVEVADQIGLRQYFASCGYELLNAVSTLKQRNFRAERCARFLADRRSITRAPCSIWNWLALSRDLQLRSFCRFDADDLQTLGFLADLGFLRWHHRDRVQFTSGEGPQFSLWRLAGAACVCDSGRAWRSACRYRMPRWG